MLSDAKKRQIYDQYGEDGLTGGGGGSQTQGADGASFMGGSHHYFHNDPMATFAQFFGQSNPFEMFVGPGFGGTEFFGEDDDGYGVRGGFGGLPGGGAFRSQSFNIGGGQDNMHGRKRPPQQPDPPIEHDLYVALDEISKGCTKKMKISRMTMSTSGQPVKEEKVLNITVKPGWKAGTKITFQREGDQIPGKIPADIVFIIRDKPNSTFKREGSDLRYSAKINLKQALCGSVITVPILTGETVSIDTKGEVIKPNTVKRLQGRGLPFPKEPSRKGDLLIAFDIQFPSHVTQSAKDILMDLLPN